MKRREFLAAGAGFAAVGAIVGCTDGSGRTVVIPRGARLIILRHADREGDHLTALGRQRAKALVGALKNEKIDAIYYPGIRRNYETAAPLAEARDVPMHRITEEHPAARLMQVGAGRSIVWVGNKGNLHSIWKDLGAPARHRWNTATCSSSRAARLACPWSHDGISGRKKL